MRSPLFTDAWAHKRASYRNAVSTDISKTFKRIMDEKKKGIRDQVAQAERRMSGKRFCTACQTMRDALNFKKTTSGRYRCADCSQKARG